MRYCEKKKKNKAPDGLYRGVVPIIHNFVIVKARMGWKSLSKSLETPKVSATLAITLFRLAVKRSFVDSFLPVESCLKRYQRRLPRSN